MSIIKPAIIIGNGPSRNIIDSHKLVGKAPLYGCNALYRDFNKSDYLIAIDDGMIDEIKSVLPTLYKNTQTIIPPEDERWESAEYSPNRRRNNAGMVAMDYAIKHGNNLLYLLGFDFILEGEDSVDNVYKDTDNYGPETHAREEDNYYRLKYFEWYVSKHLGVSVVFVIPDDKVEKCKSIRAGNVKAITTTNFLKKLED
ncbi:MAG: hypothetical protein H8D23_30160 [Candidatus Brocadiales bacterium]|nr:hypothetical protein [Candidatus Brocadiales bacterium]